MARYEYLSNPDIMDYIDNLRQKTEYVRIIVLNNEDLPLRAIEGCATAGTINVNGDSAARRTGNLTLVTALDEQVTDPLDIMYQVTEIDTLISMNKRVEIEVGIENTEFKYLDYPIFWIPLGTYVISNASVTYNNGGIQISLKLTDKMALLNGEAGGAMSGAIIHSPLSIKTGEMKENDKGELEEVVLEEPVKFYDLIYYSIVELGELSPEKLMIEDIPDQIKQAVVWDPSDAEVLVYNDGQWLDEDYKTFSLQSSPQGEMLNPLWYEFMSKNVALKEFTVEELESLSFINTTWQLQEDPSISQSIIFNIEFEAKGTRYSSLRLEYLEKSPSYIYYDDSMAFETDVHGRWFLSQTITLLTEPSIELKQWLINNSQISSLWEYRYEWNESIDWPTTSPSIDTDNIIFESNEHYYFQGMKFDWANKTISYIVTNKNSILALEEVNNNLKLQILNKMPDTQVENVRYIQPKQGMGYVMTDFVYPLSKGDLTTGANQPITALLDELKSTLGNYEYFFDVDGVFHFRQIKNYLNEGSAIDDLTQAINEKYFINTNRGQSVYNFKDANLISSYSNNPQYNKIKNDFNIWGRTPQNNNDIHYRLIIQRLPTVEEMKYWCVKFEEDKYGVLRAVYADTSNSLDTLPVPYLKEETASKEYHVFELAYEDWRLKLYFDAIRRQNYNKEETDIRKRYILTSFDKELIEQIPLMIDVSTGKIKGAPQSLLYYLDAIDTNSSDLMEKVPVKQFGIETINRRIQALNDDKINCMFATPVPDITFSSFEGSDDVYPQGTYEKGVGNKYFIPSVILSQTTMGTIENPAYEALRSSIHEHLSYNNNINITSLPVYRLDANQRISVNSDESDIHGDYIIKSISMPLGVNGNMTINAQKAIERI